MMACWLLVVKPVIGEETMVLGWFVIVVILTSSVVGGGLRVMSSADGAYCGSINGAAKPSPCKP